MLHSIKVQFLLFLYQSLATKYSCQAKVMMIKLLIIAQSFYSVFISVLALVLVNIFNSSTGYVKFGIGEAVHSCIHTRMLHTKQMYTLCKESIIGRAQLSAMYIAYI